MKSSPNKYLILRSAAEPTELPLKIKYKLNCDRWRKRENRVENNLNGHFFYWKLQQSGRTTTTTWHTIACIRSSGLNTSLATIQRNSACERGEATLWFILRAVKSCCHLASVICAISPHPLKFSGRLKNTGSHCLLLLVALVSTVIIIY